MNFDFFERKIYFEKIKIQQTTRNWSKIEIFTISETNQLSERTVRNSPHFDDIDWEQNQFICDIWDMVSNTSVSDAQIFTNTTLDACTLKYEDYVWPNSSRESLWKLIFLFLLLTIIFTVFCNWTFDTILCWPPTEAGKIAQQKCPPIHGLDQSSKYWQFNNDFVWKSWIFLSIWIWKVINESTAYLEASPCINFRYSKRSMTCLERGNIGSFEAKEIEILLIALIQFSINPKFGVRETITHKLNLKIDRFIVYHTPLELINFFIVYKTIQTTRGKSI